ncbi:MAG: putative bifunctional diguanylate cyclase/phosphodiesterase [Steroidobacteraceae bacterium]
MSRLRSLRVRLVVFLVVLLGAVQVAEFALTNHASYAAARNKIEDQFGVGQRVFARVLAQNAEHQAEAARVLASDFPFREAIATGDAATVESALENHGARIQARALLYVDLDGKVVADTLRPGAPQHPFELPALIAAARHGGEATAIAMLDGRALQLIAVPVRAPLTIGWVIVCFPIDAALARDLRQLTGLEVSFAAARHGRWSVLASTLPAADAANLPSSLMRDARGVETGVLDVPSGEQLIRVLPLGAAGGERIVAVLERPIASALASFRTLRATLIGLGVLSLALSVIGSILIALGITRPLAALLAAVKRIRQGDYSQPVGIRRDDEIGVLAEGLDHMRAGIAEREQRILRLAYEDPLTHLPNRSQFSEALERGLQEARAASSSLAILIMDLDRFKYVNDSLGHGVGDHVLQEVARRLRSLAEGALCIARLGGDEFAVLTRDASPARVKRLAERIVAVLEQPILYEEQPLDVGASIGIAFYPQHAQDSQTLVRNADIAMYAAKRSRSGYSVYEPCYDTSQQEHLSLLSELRRAVEQGELRLHYQPKLTLSSSSVMAAEALIRWEHPVRGLVPPALFIPFAEHTGYIKALTRWVLGEALRQCEVWRREGRELQISVNISARDLMNRDLPDLIAALLEKHAVPARMLCLEITESGFMEDPQHAQKVLDRLAELGVELSIDDYGTGYSSLSYIMRLPVNELKIDQAFVSRMSENPDLATIVHSTIELGHSLGLKVVAEGVEDPRGFALLRELGCDSAQGFYLSPPLAPADFVCWLDGSVPPRRPSVEPDEPASAPPEAPPQAAAS